LRLEVRGERQFYPTSPADYAQGQRIPSKLRKLS
jgi:hypothetical protein